MRTFVQIESIENREKQCLAHRLGIGELAFRLANPSIEENLYLPGYALPEGVHTFQSVKEMKAFIEPFRLSETAAWVNDHIEYDSARVEKELIALTQFFPFLKMTTIGSSVLGTPIFEISTEPSAHQYTLHLNASFHANEWITTAVLLKWLKVFCLIATFPELKGHEEASAFMQTIALSIVPMVNPDGVDLVRNGAESLGLRDEQLKPLNGSNQNYQEWKANIRGIDLNNQFPAYWEIEYYRNRNKAPSFRDFPGYKPLTEPEAKAMAQLALRKRFDRMIALHTQGEEVYWGFLGHEPATSRQTVERFEQVSGYQAIQYIDSYAGYRDWFIHQFQNEGYTLELGKGRNPLSMEQFDTIFKKTKSILWEALHF
ncbi:M14 family metallopeptidase [Bacillus sp. NPDC077027]|uniref:M14 family metallopeptidase n=1 Tax=Bacillus sp. NPDC077027 TaxID=3390548 RepID=UPI003CFC753B